MALYLYVKKKQSRYNKLLDFVSYLSMTLGCLFLFWSFYPVIAFEIYSRLFIDQKVTSPVPSAKATGQSTKNNSILGKSDVFSTNLVDYTKAAVWFPEAEEVPVETPQPLPITEYFLSIPTLNINEAKVIVGGEDLLKGLVHYQPKCFPGEPCNVAIFGHSTLLQLHRPNDLKSIFTYLPTLKNGDSVYIKMNDFTYEYKVYDKFVVKPDQVSVLDQQYDDSYLSLITCSPPGTYFLRTVVKAKLTKL